MWLKLIALALMALILIPSGAHLFELPAKMQLSKEGYFAVQQIYAGWALFAVPIIAAIGANALFGHRLRRIDPTAARAAWASSILTVISLVIFFGLVFPANGATFNWTQIPANWEELRLRWEYGHAAIAVVVFIALLLTGRAIMSPRLPR